jgi:hypothetical protein
LPNRIIRDAAKTSPSLAGLSDLAERTFWRLIVTLDDFGRYHGSSMVLFASAYPIPTPGLTFKRFEAALEELETGGLVRFYEVEGRRYVMSPTWQKYQRLRSASSKFPQPLCSVSGGHRAVMPPPSAAGVGVGVGVGNGEQPHAPSRRSGVPSGFTEFWTAYPKKRAKGDALKAWTALKPDAPLLARILHAVESQRETPDWLKAQGRYIPYPATWLRAQRWEDVLDPSPHRLTVDEILR